MSSLTARAYDLHDLDRMFADEARTGPYLASIAETVRPGDVVVEIGSGTGYFAVACVRAGARRVYAIEVNPAVALGPAVAKANDCSDRITFIHGYSTRVELPERGDVLLEDLRGQLPLLRGRIPSLVDARDRLLKPDARLITARDELWAAPCRRPERVTPLLGLESGSEHGINREPVAERLRSDFYRAHVTPDDLLAAPARWAEIDYSVVRDPDLSGQCRWTLERPGAFDGFVLWFNCELRGGHWILNEPSAPSTIYGQAYFPLKQSLAVSRGDLVSLDFRARLMGDSYLFVWETTYKGTGTGTVEGTGTGTVEGTGTGTVEGTGTGTGETVFRQSTLGASLPLTIDALRRRHSSHNPRPDASATLVRDILDLADGTRALGAIAGLVAQRHPGRFSSEADAETYCTEFLAALEDEDAERTHGEAS